MHILCFKPHHLRPLVRFVGGAAHPTATFTLIPRRLPTGLCHPLPLQVVVTHNRSTKWRRRTLTSAQTWQMVCTKGSTMARRNTIQTSPSTFITTNILTQVSNHPHTHTHTHTQSSRDICVQTFVRKWYIYIYIYIYHLVLAGCVGVGLFGRVLDRAKDHGVEKMVVVGGNLEDSLKAINLCRKFGHLI